MIDKFKEYLKNTGKSEGTIKIYMLHTKLFLKWFKEAGFSEKISKDDLQMYVTHRRTKGCKASSLNLIIYVMKNFAKFMEKEGLILNSNCSFKALPIESLAPKSLSKNDTYKIIRTSLQEIQLAEVNKKPKDTSFSYWSAIRNHAIIMSMVGAGLRKQEVIDLSVNNVNIQARSGSITIIGKGSKERVVPLNSDTRSSFSNWLTVRDKYEHHVSKYFFLTKNNQIMTKDTITYIVREIAEKAGIKNVSPHTLRHTFAKRLIDQGVPLTEIKKLLGHASLETTAIYVNPSLTDLSQSVEKINLYQGEQNDNGK